MIGYLLTHLLQIYCRVWWWKNFENRLAFRRVTGKNKVVLFSGHGVERNKETHKSLTPWTPWLHRTAAKGNCFQDPPTLWSHTHVSDWRQLYCCSERFYQDSRTSVEFWRKQILPPNPIVPRCILLRPFGRNNSGRIYRDRFRRFKFLESLVVYRWTLTMCLTFHPVTPTASVCNLFKW